MNKKHIAIIVLACLAVFLAGCSGGESQGTAGSPFIGGTKGIVAEFEPLSIEESGVYTIYDTDTFPIQILLKNKGEEDVAVNDATVKIEGIYLNDFSPVPASEKKNDELVEKISDVNADGGEVIVDFGSDVMYKPAILGEFVPLEILAKYTYKYKTTVSVPKVCFSDDIQDKTVCSVDGTKTSYSSGAPIQVTSVDEKSAGSGKSALTFTVENVGGGSSTVIGSEFNTRYDQVSYKIVPDTEAAKWKCRSAGRENEARFADGKTTIVCELIDPVTDKYTKEVVLEISYEYRDFIQESLRIKKSS